MENTSNLDNSKEIKYLIVEFANGEKIKIHLKDGVNIKNKEANDSHKEAVYLFNSGDDR